MCRILFVVLALAACASAESSKYAFNQENEIEDRIEDCLKPLNDHDLIRPAAQCTTGAKWSLAEGEDKTQLPAEIVQCLHDYRGNQEQPINETLIENAEICLKDAMAKDVSDPLTQADYTPDQLTTIGCRIKNCESSIPETTGTPASDCRNDALLEAGEGYPKEYLVNFIVPCLEKKNITQETVIAVENCLKDSLQKELPVLPEQC